MDGRRPQTTQHEVEIFDVIRSKKGWLTVREITQLCKRVPVSDRTVRQYCLRFVELGICDHSPLYGGYRYRMKQKFEPVARQQIARLDAARELLFQE
jgi:DNA-binding IclR family transcriptional regulator